MCKQKREEKRERGEFQCLANATTIICVILTSHHSAGAQAAQTVFVTSDGNTDEWDHVEDIKTSALDI